MRFAAVFAVLLPTLGAVVAEAAPDPGTRPVVQAPRILDFERRLDPFAYDLYTTNFGALAYDLAQGAPGLEFPRGSGKSVIFASGLWVGAQVAGEKRVTVAEYSQEWQPGRILGGVPEDSNGPNLLTWKVVTADGIASPDDTANVTSGTGDPIRHHGWSEYAARAGSVGAPVRMKRLPVDGNPSDSVDVPAPDLPGAWALWSVFNDADPSSHTNDAGASVPLGLEVRQTVYAHPTLPQVAFVRWTLFHRGGAALDSAYVGFWSDPDIGNASDDHVGWAAAHHMGYGYNGQNADGVYGATPPAAGIRLVSAPPGVSPAAFSAFISGVDPSNPIQSYRALQGLLPDGNEVVDPTTGLPTRFWYPGDPLTSTGWIAPFGVDRRMLVSVGPFFLSPGDSAEFTFAFVMAQGLNRFDSVQRLFCQAELAKLAFDQGFAGPLPPLPPECEGIAGSCPVPASTWAGFCADPSQLPPDALPYVAGLVQSATRGIVLPPPIEDSFCDSVSVTGAGTPRQRAVREYLTMLANLNPMPGTTSPKGKLVGLSGEAPVSCAWTTATTVAELAEPAPDLSLLDVVYESTDGEPADYAAVDFGLESYGGGAGFGVNFLASSLDPYAQPDSFPDVEVRFDTTSTQKAYRYLRLQKPDGTIPAGGREYRYGGYRSVPLEAVDRATGERLELAFVERAYVDDSGTLLDSFLQPATFDSTWAPNIDGDGAREYLFVLKRPDGGSPRAEMEVDGEIIDLVTPPPVLYVATLYLAEEGNLPEPGEKLVYDVFPASPSRGVDARLLALRALPQDDSKTIAGYEEIVACLSAINAGLGIGAECDPTPVALTLEEGVVEGGVARLAWYVSEQGAGPFDLARRPADDAAATWTMLARLSVDGSRRVFYEDRAIAPGERWTYGLFDPADPSHPLDTVTLDVPAATGFALRISAGTRGVAAQAHFTLPARGEARLVLYDAAGRKRHEESFGVLDAGAHRRPIAPSAVRGAPGLYFAKLVFGGRSVVARAVLLD